MKKNYLDPSLKVSKFESEDVITTSGLSDAGRQVESEINAMQTSIEKRTKIFDYTKIVF